MLDLINTNPASAAASTDSLSSSANVENDLDNTVSSGDDMTRFG